MAERDMGVLLTTSQTSQHYTNITRKANQILGFVHRGITIRPREIIILLYSALVRLRGDLMIVCSFLMRGSGGTGTDVFAVTSDRTLRNGVELCQGMFRILEKGFSARSW